VCLGWLPQGGPLPNGGGGRQAGGVTPEDVALLRSAAAADALRAATEAYADDAEPDLFGLTERLRAEGHDPVLVALALTQGRLRRRAAVRLGPRGGRLLWTQETLEQATRPEVAAHRATRLAGFARVADLCCGAGADALALADAGPQVLAVDRDPTVAALAAANAAAEGHSGRITVRTADVTTLRLAGLGCEAAYVDPARRAGAHRRQQPETWSPPWSWIADLAREVPATVAKVAPGIPHSLIPPDAEGEWVSVRGELKEAAIWHGPLATARRRATLLPAGTVLTDADLPPSVAVGAVEGWLVEPDDAIIRAGLVGAVAQRLAGHLLDRHIAYVTTETEPDARFGAVFEVLEEIPFALKRMRAVLRARGVGDVVVKKRGVGVAPEELRRRLALGGDGPIATLVLTRTEGGPLALLVARYDPPRSGDPAALGTPR